MSAPSAPALRLCCLLLGLSVGCGERVSDALDAGTGAQPRTDVDGPQPAEPDAATDTGPMCGPPGGCDLWTVDGCGAGQACRLLLDADDLDGGVDDPRPRCAAHGSGRDGDPCTRGSDCGAGLDCSGDDGEGGGRCRRYCCELNHTAGCPGGQFCRNDLIDAHGDSADVALCDDCDDCEFDGEDCPDGMGCYPLGGGDGGRQTCRACLPAGRTLERGDCDAQNDCAAGLLCFQIGGRFQCAAPCSLGALSAGGTGGAGGAGGAGDCGEAEVCTPLAGGPLDDDHGLCLDATN